VLVSFLLVTRASKFIAISSSFIPLVSVIFSNTGGAMVESGLFEWNIVNQSSFEVVVGSAAVGSLSAVRASVLVRHSAGTSQRLLWYCTCMLATTVSLHPFLFSSVCPLPVPVRRLALESDMLVRLTD
jgi:hypothetical protein